MFESFNRKPLPEGQFEAWLEDGRSHALGYHYLLIIWNELDSKYYVQYLQERSEVLDYKTSAVEVVIAAYDVYSESRIQLH